MSSSADFKETPSRLDICLTLTLTGRVFTELVSTNYPEIPLHYTRFLDLRSIQIDRTTWERLH